MKTLYLSDLDGTLLKSDETLSAFTCRAIERLAEQGMLFSYATARSYNTAKKVTAPLGAVELPLIVYNGAFIRENKSGRILLSNYFENGAEKIIAELLQTIFIPSFIRILTARNGFLICMKSARRARGIL